MRAEELFHMFPQVMRSRWEQVAGLADRLQEIRLRVNVPADRKSTRLNSSH